MLALFMSVSIIYWLLWFAITIIQTNTSLAIAIAFLCFGISYISWLILKSLYDIDI